MLVYNAGFFAGVLFMAGSSATSRSWFNVVLMALSAFVFNTTEFVPVGLLADLGRSFSMTAAQIGPMLTIYAWVVALVSLPAMLLLANTERRRLLLGVFALFVVSHMLSAVAGSYAVLLCSRIGIALAHCVFWSITAAMAVRLAPEGRAPQALSLLATGTVLAMVLGIPLGRVIGETFGWRVTFAAIGVVALLIMLALWRWLPPMPVVNSGDLRSLPAIIGNRPLCWLYLLTVVTVTGQFTGYTYLEPLIQQALHFPAEVTTITLLVFGAAGILGSYLFSRYQNRHPNSLLLNAIAGLAICLGVLSWSGLSFWLLQGLVLYWGVAMMLTCLALQARVLTLAAGETDIAMAIYSGIFNIGIGGGALLGSQVAIRLGVEHNGTVGCMVLLLTLLPLWQLLRRR